MAKFEHIPVLKDEVTSFLGVAAGGIFVDGTLGAGGHTKQIIEKYRPNLVIGIDQDAEALEAAKENLSDFKNVTLVHDNFRNLDKILSELKISQVDAILVDIGVSSYQIDTPERGFSFRFDSKLDMRMDKSKSFSAFDVVNNYSLEELERVIRDYGEEKFAKSIAKHIASAREVEPIVSTKQLEGIVLSSVPRYRGQDGSSNVQRTFQAIRIEVNGELDALKEFLEVAVERLKPHGRLAVISFHSLEDRIVKQKFKELATGCICPPGLMTCVCGHKASVNLITKHPVTAGEDELKRNPRSASAKLRVVEKI